MSNDKLRKLSNPVAYIFDHGVMGPGDFKYGTPQMNSAAKDENASPLYSQEYVSALLAELEAKDKRILELDYLRLSACEVFKKIGNELGCNPDNESIMMAIDDLKATQMTGPLKDVLKRNIELESKMATPVQPPELTGDEDLAECVFKYVAAIRAAGFTVEGDE